MSYNELGEIESAIFDPPENLTNLYLSHNQLVQLPMDKILPMAKLQILDIEDNEFGGFDESMMKIIKNQTILLYAGNPLNCDCYVRPLRRWLTSLTETPEEWTRLTCASPDYLAGKRLPKVSEELMTCGEREIQDNPAFEITPDLKFRNIELYVLQ